MRIWKQSVTLETLKDWSKDTLMEHLGIEYLEIGDDFLRARLPVDNRTRQPMGLLHGGASVALAETLGSLASYLCVDPAIKRTLGLEINANHLRGVSSGWVIGTTRPLHIGRTTQVWEIDIRNEQGKRVCVSRHTVAVLDL